ncbi:MAG: class I SAM-dependent methyltransferase [Candidatus Thorarchaeota archaeon]
MDKLSNSSKSEQNFFTNIYNRKPPWEIGRPQQAFIHLIDQISLKGKLLDVGCGTGENSIFFAKHGFDVTGIDYVREAINKALQKAEKRNINIKFYVLNALKLEGLNQKFDVIIDSGLFHTFSNLDRKQFKESLSHVLHKNGLYFMLCFSNLEPPGFGPRRISKEDIYNTFNHNWEILSIEPEIFESNFGNAKAWLAKIEYLG